MDPIEKEDVPMKKLVSLLLALVMLFSVAAFAESTTEVNVDTNTARENLTWEFQKDEYKLVCYWPAPDVFFEIGRAHV